MSGKYGKGQNIIQFFEQLAPKHLALADDRIGLQVGTLNKEIKKVMLTLDVLENVVDEAMEKNVDLIIAHHPVIFKPLKNLRTDLPQGRLYEKLLKNNIAVYVAHSNLDAANGGVNDVLVRKIGLEDVQLLEVTYSERLKKIVVFVPAEFQQQVLDALAASGAGWIGNYSHCSFKLQGIGTFMPREGTNPFIGEKGKLEKVNEVRIETVVPEEKQAQAIKAMIKAHPYEEVAYDIYPLDVIGKEYGIGRLGRLNQPMLLKDFIPLVKQSLDLDGVRVITDDPNKIVSKIAIVGGDGNSFVQKAIFQGADVLITGDIYYHVAHEAMGQGMAIIDAGHHIEKYAMEDIKKYLENELLKHKLETEIIISSANTNPFTFF